MLKIKMLKNIELVRIFPAAEGYQSLHLYASPFIKFSLF